MSWDSLYGILGVAALGLAAGVGVLLAVIQLPGTWLIVAAAVAYDWCHGWERLGPVVLGVLAGLAVLGELVELGASMWFAGKAGGSRRASWGGLLGGVVGMFVFTFPVPVIGTIVGGIVGCFTGALIAELTVRDDLGQVTRVGVGAALGRVAGTSAKLFIALVMAGLALSWAIFR